MRSRNDVDLSFVLDRRGRRSLQKLVHIEMCSYLPDKSKFIIAYKVNKKSHEWLFFAISGEKSQIILASSSISSLVVANEVAKRTTVLPSGSFSQKPKRHF